MASALRAVRRAKVAHSLRRGFYSVASSSVEPPLHDGGTESSAKGTWTSRQEPEEGDVRVCPENPTRWQLFKLNKWRWKCSVNGCLRVPYFGAFNDGVPRRCAFHAHLQDCQVKNSLRTVYGSGFASSKGSWRVAIPNAIENPGPVGWAQANSKEISR